MILTKFWSITLVVAVALVVACGGAAPPASTPDRLVPAQANLIAQVQVDRILQDADLQGLYQQAPKNFDDPQTLDEALNLAFEASGIDFRSFRTVTLFSDVAQAEDYIGVIAKGQFDEARLVAAIQEEAGVGFTSREYKGVTLHVDESDSDVPALAVLDSDTLVAGTVPAVENVIDVWDSSLPPISGKAYDTFSSMGTPLLRMAMTVPPEALGELNNSLGSGMSFAPAAMSAVQDLEVVAVMADKNGDAIQFRADLDFFTADSATQLGDMIDGLIKFVSGISPDPNLPKLLNMLDIDVIDNRLTVNFQTTISELQELAEGMGNGIAGFAP
ncbi:MAG: hypothetical protein ACE5Q6_16140 [Dehalococcoidia bacterium]